AQSLLHARQAKSLTAKQLAQAAGVTREAVETLEGGTVRGITAGMLLRILRVAGLDLQVRAVAPGPGRSPGGGVETLQSVAARTGLSRRDVARAIGLYETSRDVDYPDMPIQAGHLAT